MVTFIAGCLSDPSGVGDDESNNDEIQADVGDDGDVNLEEDADAVCEPQSCDDLEAQCGSLDDGCGNELDCGDCEIGTCDSAQNRCDCSEQDEEDLCDYIDAECGTHDIDDICKIEGMLTCDDCDDDDKCREQSDASHICVEVENCEPETDFDDYCKENSLECGQVMVPDGCGGSVEVDCETCDHIGENATCQENQCQCTPTPQQELCEDFQCTPRNLEDGCGAEATCESECVGAQECTDDGECCTVDILNPFC